MKRKLIVSVLTCILISTSIYAQSQKKSSILAKKSSRKQQKGITKNTDHIGTWKLVSQRVTYGDGRVESADSSQIFLRKIITPTTFVVIVEKKIPDYNNKKLATSVAGGRYSLIDGNYQEFTKYAAFKDFENMKVSYKLTIENGKLHTVGTVGGSTIYDEVYIRED